MIDTVRGKKKGTNKTTVASASMIQEIHPPEQWVPEKAHPWMRGEVEPFVDVFRDGEADYVSDTVRDGNMTDREEKQGDRKVSILVCAM